MGLSGVPCSPSTWLPSGSNGDTQARRGGTWNMSPFMARVLCPPLAGVAAKRPGVDFNPAILGKGQGSCRGSPLWLPIIAARPE